MKWFLLAFIVYAETGRMDVKFNTALRFDKLDECQIYLMLSCQTATPSAASALYPAAMTERLGVPRRYFI